MVILCMGNFGGFSGSSSAFRRVEVHQIRRGLPLRNRLVQQRLQPQNVTANGKASIPTLCSLFAMAIFGNPGNYEMVNIPPEQGRQRPGDEKSRRYARKSPIVRQAQSFRAMPCRQQPFITTVWFSGQDRRTAQVDGRFFQSKRLHYRPFSRSAKL